MGLDIFFSKSSTIGYFRKVNFLVGFVEEQIQEYVPNLEGIECTKEMAEELKKASPFLRSELAKRMDLRNTPELRFEFDESTLYGEHIDEILQEIHSENRE